MAMNLSVGEDVRQELTGTRGVLRVGFNMGNALLVTGKTPDGDPIGVARSMAESIAETLGVPLKCVPFPKPAEVADAAASDAWDICLIGAEPARAERIAFTNAYVEIRARYLVHAGSPLKTVDDVDQTGIRIVVKAGAAYELWLTRNIKRAAISRRAETSDVLRQFADGDCDVLAGLEEQVLVFRDQVPGSRLLDGMFTSVQQAIGTHKRNTAAARFLDRFVSEAIKSGLVAELIAKHQVRGLAVAAA